MELLENLELLSINEILAAIDDRLEGHPDLLLKGGIDDALQVLLSLDLLVEHPEGNVFDNGELMQLVVYIHLLAHNIDQEIVILLCGLPVIRFVSVNHFIVWMKGTRIRIFVDNLENLAWFKFWNMIKQIFWFFDLHLGVLNFLVLDLVASLLKINFFKVFDRVLLVKTTCNAF